MKRNVDLTENRFFSSNIPVASYSISLFTGEKFPWNVYFKEVNSDDDLTAEHQRNRIIAVGDKETRAKVRYYREMDSLDYCDCCGKHINLIPWDREIGLCHQCNDRFLKDVDRCKWRKKEIIRNAVI